MERQTPINRGRKITSDSELTCLEEEGMDFQEKYSINKPVDPLILEKLERLQNHLATWKAEARRLEDMLNRERQEAVTKRESMEKRIRTEYELNQIELERELKWFKEKYREKEEEVNSLRNLLQEKERYFNEKWAREADRRGLSEQEGEELFRHRMKLEEEFRQWQRVVREELAHKEREIKIEYENREQVLKEREARLEESLKEYRNKLDEEYRRRREWINLREEELKNESMEFEKKERDLYLAYKKREEELKNRLGMDCLLYTSPSPRDLSTSRMPSSA